MTNTSDPTYVKYIARYMEGVNYQNIIDQTKIILMSNIEEEKAAYSQLKLKGREAYVSALKSIFNENSFEMAEEYVNLGHNMNANPIIIQHVTSTFISAFAEIMESLLKNKYILLNSEAVLNVVVSQMDLAQLSVTNDQNKDQQNAEDPNLVVDDEMEYQSDSDCPNLEITNNKEKSRKRKNKRKKNTNQN
jgi:hypothetical protein